MPHFTKHDKYAIKTLVTDCILFNFSEQEALVYIRARLGGKNISPAHYYRVKKWLNSGDSADMWLNQQGKVGFAVNYRDRVEEVLRLQHNVMHELAMENFKAREDRDMKLVIDLTKTAADLNMQLVQLQMGIPIVMKIKSLTASQKPVVLPKIDMEKVIDAEIADYPQLDSNNDVSTTGTGESTEDTPPTGTELLPAEAIF